MSDNYQLQTWASAHGNREVEGLVAQVFFARDKHTLDANDRTGLNNLRGPYQVLLLAHRLHFWCIGNADHRGADSYNDRLALRRATSVKTFLDGIFDSCPFYSASRTETRGEIMAQWPMPSRDQMAEDRRVDVYASRLPNQPPIELPVTRISGRTPPRISIREVGQAEQGAQNWMPAGRNSRPVQIDNLPGDRTANHPVGQIPRLFSYANQVTIERNIQAGIDELRPVLAWRMMDHATGGILVVAVIDVSRDARVSVGSVRAVFDFQGVFAQPRDAISVWRSEPSLFAPRLRPPNGSLNYRFFWVTRDP